MEDSELSQGSRPRDRPKLRYKDACKRDLKALNIDTKSWEAAAFDHSYWKQTGKCGLLSFETEIKTENKETENKKGR